MKPLRAKLLTLLISLTIVQATASAITLDEAPAEPGDWGYRPAPDVAAELNPPGFSWRPTKEAAAYVMEIAADTDFDEVVYRSAPIAWSAHCPDVTLPAGTLLHWRYAARDAEGTQSGWSFVRSFTIAPDAVAFPKPSLDELLKRIPEGHPRLFFRPEQVEKLRDLANGKLAQEFAAIRAAADKLIANPPDSSEPPLYPEGTVRLSDEWRKIWWGNRMRTIAVLDGAATLAFVYHITGEEQYAFAARDLLMAVTQWDTEGSTNYQYNDEAAMPALKMGARAYSWIYPVLTPEERATAVAMLRIRGQQAFDHLQRGPHIWRPYGSHSNRSWHFLGEVAIACYGEFPEAAEWLDYATAIFYSAYPVWSDSDGGWHEGAAYWSSYLSRFMYWALTMKAMFNIDVFERPFFKETGYFGMYVAPPGTMTSGFADQASHTTSKSLAPLVGTLALAANNPYWKWYAEQHGDAAPGGYTGFMLAAQGRTLEAKPPTDLPTSMCFRGVGIAALNSNLLDGRDTLQLLFKSSPMGRISHGYNANNAFILNLHGTPALVTSGRRDVHGSPHHTLWMWHSKSDNAILVNGEGQIKHSPKATGRIAAFETSPAVDVVVGEAAESYTNLKRWTRRIVFLKEHAIIIHDILEAPEPSTFAWQVHSAAELGVDGQRLSYRADNGAFDLDLLHPQGLAITQTDLFDPPPAEWTDWDLRQWHVTASAEENVKELQFFAVIRTGDTSAALDMEAKTLQLEMPHGPAIYTWTDTGFSITSGQYKRSF